MFVNITCLFPRNCFLAKYLSGRIIELDKVYEPEHNDQSSATSEMVPEAATMIMAPMSTKCYCHGDQSTYACRCGLLCDQMNDL